MVIKWQKRTELDGGAAASGLHFGKNLLCAEQIKEITPHSHRQLRYKQKFCRRQRYTEFGNFLECQWNDEVNKHEPANEVNISV